MHHPPIRCPGSSLMALAQRLGLGVALSLLVAAPAPSARAALSSVRFDRDIRPILSENCFPCHGADANKRKGKLRLDIPHGAQGAPVIFPGKPDQSERVKRIFSSDNEERMPPPVSHKQLSPEQKQLLSQWIRGGAAYENHWAFEAPTRPPVPQIRKKSWPNNPIDNFVLQK